MLKYGFESMAAKLANDLKTERNQRSIREYARRGRYHRGNRAPYGWKKEATQHDNKGQPVEYKLVHDPETYPTRLGF